MIHQVLSGKNGSDEKMPVAHCASRSHAKILVKVIWTPEAQKDREDIWEFIANENPFAATKMEELFSD